MSLRLAAACAVALLVATGCSTVRQSANLPAEIREARLAGLQVWSLRGRIAVRDAEGQGGQARLGWQQSEASTYLDLAGPFGAGRIMLTFEPSRAAAATADGELEIEYSGADAAERFMADQLGWSFPVQSARYWVRALADPASAAQLQRDTSGLPVELQQHGWTVRYESYDEYEGVMLPVKVQLQNPRFRLKLVVSDWALALTPG